MNRRDLITTGAIGAAAFAAGSGLLTAAASQRQGPLTIKMPRLPEHDFPDLAADAPPPPMADKLRPVAIVQVNYASPEVGHYADVTYIDGVRERFHGDDMIRRIGFRLQKQMDATFEDVLTMEARLPA